MPPMSSEVINPTIISPEIGANTSITSPTSVPKDVLNELLLIFSVIGSTSTASKKKPGNLNDPIDTNIIPVADCLNWLQDLQRALRRDDDAHRPISILLAHWRMVEHKLIPLAISCKYDTAIVMTITKILVILTKPMSAVSKRAARLILDPKKTESAVLEEQMKLRENAIQQSEMLMQYKKLIVQHDSALQKSSNDHKVKDKKIASSGTSFLSIVVSLLSEPLARTGSARTDSDHLTIELVLHLFRNLLSADPVIRASAESTEKAATLHRQLVCLFEQEHVLEVILVLAQDMEARENSHYNLLLMEILHSLIRNEDAALIVQSYQRSISPPDVSNRSQKHLKNMKSKSRTSSELLSLLRSEKKKTLTAPNRHSHFGGMLTFPTSTGKKRVLSTNRVFDLSHLHGRNVESYTAHLQKPKRKNIKHTAFIGSKTNTNDQMKINMSQAHSSPLYTNFQNTLYRFSEDFLSKSYAPLTKSLKNEFRRESSRLEASDKLLYFKIVHFFSVFGRHAKKQKRSRLQHLKASDYVDKDVSAIGSIVFTMDIFSFSLLFKSIVSYNDNKKYLELAQAVRLYKEMMHLLYEMSISKDETERDMTFGLMDRLFYSNEPTDLMGKLFSWWKPGICTREYLADIVELHHISLKLLSKYAKGENLDDESRKKRKLPEGESHVDLVSRIRKEAEEFNVDKYFGKHISNHIVFMYTMLLAEYSSNSPQVNHYIVSFFTRMCKHLIFVPNEDDEYNAKQLKLKKTTCEPMLFNIHLLAVFSKILNDKAIRDKKEYSQVLQFSAIIIRHFSQAANENNVLFIESLFRFPNPHRVCEKVNNLYVTEELVMIGERETLLERAREEEESENENDDDNHDNSVTEATGSTSPTINTTQKEQKEYSTGKELELVDSDDEEEGNSAINDVDRNKEIHDEKKVEEASTLSKKSSLKITKKRKRIKKIGQIVADDSDDDLEAFGTEHATEDSAIVNSSQLVFDDDLDDDE